jgi:formiminotetrahydrofolate cyclodeaminase
MRDQTIGQYLDELASAAPAPGGGAVAALHAAQAAALVGMVCNLTLGNERYAAAAATMRDVRDAADGLRARALALAEQDAAAYAAVAGAYHLPRATEAERASRTDAIQAALRDATAVPLDTAELAAQVIELCGRIVDSSNPSVLSDVGVAAVSAGAALHSAGLNVRVNLALMKDTAAAAAAADRLEAYLRSAVAADGVFRAVRERVRP